MLYNSKRMDFVAYLISKNIDPQKFEASEEATFQKWKEEFAQIHPKSFTSQKLFVINEIRRRFQLHLGAKPKEKAVKPVENPVADLPLGHEKGTMETQEVPISKAKPVFKKPAPNSNFLAENKSVTPVDVITDNVQTSISSGEIPVPKTVAKPIFKRPNSEVVNPNDEVKAEAPIEGQQESKVATENVIKKAGAKPIFKRPETKLEAETELQTKPPIVEDTEATPTPKVTVKPVFKRPEIAQNNTVADAEQTNQTEKQEPAKKPIVKPIFKRPEIPQEPTSVPAESKSESEIKTEENTVPAKKPMAKPIFKRPEQSSGSESQS